MCSLRILIDTNIFIDLENCITLDSKLAKLDKIHRDNAIKLLIHPMTKNDLMRDKNDIRKDKNLSILEKYPTLESPPDYTSEFLNKFLISPTNENDRVDYALLSAIYGNAVSYLITEDKGIHKLSKKLDISQRVFYINDALELLEDLFEKKKIEIANVKEISLHEITQYLNSEFFNSLRDDYPEFNNWFNKQAQQGRQAWISPHQNKVLRAICIYKEEDPEVLTKDNRALPGKALKLCTFKVDEAAQGKKIGELFLKAAFQYAFKNSLSFIYVTVLPKHERLISLFEDFGFYNFGIKKNSEELVLVKDHPQTAPAKRLEPVFTEWLIA